MSLVQIGSEANEMIASITKGYLESSGVKVSIGPSNANRGNKAGSTAGPFGIYVEEADAKEAAQMLQERG